MKTPEEYMDLAEECLADARRPGSRPEHRESLVRVAGAYESLAMTANALIQKAGQ